MTNAYAGTVNPIKITEARKARGYNMAELATLIGVSRQAVLRYEQGQSNPSDKVLMSLCEQLGFSISYFYNTLSLNETESVTFFRSLKTAESKYREMINVRCDWAGLIYLYLCKYLNLPKVRLPQTDLLLRGENITVNDIENCAALLRQHWKLGNGPIGNLTSCVENNGLIVFGGEISNYKVDACHKMIAGKPFVFITQDKDSCCRYRFSLAHELGHMLLHSFYISIDDLRKPNVLKQIESEANRFAASFLLPKEEMINDVCSTNLNFLLLLKKKWKVSLSALIHRSKELGIFDDEQATMLYRQISYRNWRTHEPLDDEITLEEPKFFKTALKILFDNNIKSRQEFVDTFDLPLEDLAQLCNTPISFFIDEPDKMSISIVK